MGQSILTLYPNNLGDKQNGKNADYEMMKRCKLTIDREVFSDQGDLTIDLRITDLKTHKSHSVFLSENEARHVAEYLLSIIGINKTNT